MRLRVASLAWTTEIMFDTVWMISVSMASSWFALETSTEGSDAMPGMGKAGLGGRDRNFDGS